jgi:hypothetical protein
MTFVFTSETTGETKVMDMPMDVSFFWPNSWVSPISSFGDI